jgi:hypothetical protein
MWKGQHPTVKRCLISDLARFHFTAVCAGWLADSSLKQQIAQIFAITLEIFLIIYQYRCDVVSHADIQTATEAKLVPLKTS